MTATHSIDSPARRAPARPRPAPSFPTGATLPWGRRYLMCPPAYFDVVYSINPWMNTAVAVDARRAEAQWTSLVDTLREAGAEVELVDPRPGLPDMAFTANAGLVAGRTFVPALMRHAERRGERPHFEAWFSARGYRLDALDGDVVHEGAGDALAFAGRLVTGYRTRSSAEACDLLARRLGADVVAVELRDPRYFHLDLTFCPLDGERAIVAPFAWTQQSRDRLDELVPEPLVLRPEEAATFCANSVVVDRTVVMPACPRRVRRRLERWGFDVVVCDVGEFLKAGGGVRCLTLALDVPRAAFAPVLAEGGRRAAGRNRAAAPTGGRRPAVSSPRGAARIGQMRRPDRSPAPSAGTATGPPAAATHPPGKAPPPAAAPTVPEKLAEPPPTAASPPADLAPAADPPPPEQLAERYCAHNYAPLPVVVARAQGAWVYDPEGRPYLDALAAYSALNFGHGHPDLVAAARRQLERLTLTSRAFHNDQLGPFCHDLAELCGKELVLPMNTGAEAVETAIKTARKWGYEVKGVPRDRATIIVCEGNFHGRTTTIVSFSDDPLARRGFGPYTPGFRSVPFGDLDALRSVLADEAVVAFLVEPIQGEAGVVVPPDGYLRAARDLCRERAVLLIADEIQSGLGRTGRTFACDHEGVEPDVYVLGKALGGGIVPLSAVAADEAILGVLRPGEHGSTFGGNPLACAVGRAVVRLVATGEYQDCATRLGARFLAALHAAALPGVEAIRARGLWAGIDLAGGGPSARAVCERLIGEGVLAKDAHERTIRLAPPLVVTEDELDFLVDALGDALSRAGSRGGPRS